MNDTAVARRPRHDRELLSHVTDRADRTRSRTSHTYGQAGPTPSEPTTPVAALLSLPAGPMTSGAAPGRPPHGDPLEVLVRSAGEARVAMIRVQPERGIPPEPANPCSACAAQVPDDADAAGPREEQGDSLAGPGGPARNPPSTATRRRGRTTLSSDTREATTAAPPPPRPTPVRQPHVARHRVRTSTPSGKRAEHLFVRSSVDGVSPHVLAASSIDATLVSPRSRDFDDTSRRSPHAPTTLSRETLTMSCHLRRRDRGGRRVDSRCRTSAAHLVHFDHGPVYSSTALMIDRGVG